MLDFERGLIQLLEGTTKVKVIDISNQLKINENQDYEKEVQELFNLMVERNNQYKQGIKKDFENVVYVINSISELLKSLTPDGKDKLEVLLEKASKNYCIYIIVSDIITNINIMSISSWYKQHLSVGNGIWIGNNITQQCMLKLTEYTNLNQEISKGFGYIVENGKARLVKLISEEKE